jgi:hypothetical protein
MSDDWLIMQRDALVTALKIFLGHDDRFQVSVGGNPIAVDKMLEEARHLVGAQRAPRCGRCGSSGDVFMMCAGCQSPLTSTPAETAQGASPKGLYRGFEVRCPRCESWFEPEDFEELENSSTITSTPAQRALPEEGNGK